MENIDNVSDIERILPILINEQELIIKPFHSGKILIIFLIYLILLSKALQMRLELKNMERLYQE
jgi:hypothetical protein